MAVISNYPGLVISGIRSKGISLSDMGRKWERYRYKKINSSNFEDELRTVLKQKRREKMKKIALLFCYIAFGFLSLQGQTVEIIRDSYWIPHIIGDTPRECAYGLARSMCEDRPKVIIDYILEVRGRLAEAYGNSFLGSDKIVRALGIYATADSAFNELPTDVAEYFNGFALGCTDYFTEHPEVLPPEVQNMDILPITGVDAYALGSLYPLSQQMSLFKEEAGISTDSEEASNQWAIMPARTQDDALYLLCDPHVPFNMFGGSYEAHLISLDGALDFEGYFNASYVAMGHNRHVAWSHTSNKPDFADAYEVTLDPNDPDRYLLDGDSKPFTVWQEIIKIAGESPDTVTFRKSRDHGIVVDTINAQRVLTAKLELIDTPPAGEQMFEMMTASNITDFQTACALHQYGKGNTVAMDDQGEIYYVYLGRAHYRNDPVAARTGTLDGSVSSTLWQDLIPFDELPSVTNPASGYLQNCNDAPWYVTTDPGFDQSDVPKELYDGDTFGIRGRRATELISLGGDTLGTEYLKRVALDLKVVQWDSVDTVLQLALQESAADSFIYQQQADSLADLLFQWNGKAETQSTVMPLFYAWYFLTKNDMNFMYPAGIDSAKRRLMVKKLVEAPQMLISAFGTSTVTWGEIHGFERNHTWFPISGDQELQTARMGGWRNQDVHNRLIVDRGNHYMMVIRFKAGEAPAAWTMKPYGQSNDSTSVHYDDLTALYSADSLRKTWYEESEYRTHAERIETFLVTGIGDQDGDIDGLPYTFALYRNYPNPFNPATTIRFQLPKLSLVRMEVYNILGQKVKTLVDERKTPGRYTVQWDGTNDAGQRVASGVYLYRLKAGSFVQTRKMVLLR